MNDFDDYVDSVPSESIFTVQDSIALDKEPEKPPITESLWQYVSNITTFIGGFWSNDYSICDKFKKRVPVLKTEISLKQKQIDIITLTYNEANKKIIDSEDELKMIQKEKNEYGDKLKCLLKTFIESASAIVNTANNKENIHDIIDECNNLGKLINEYRKPLNNIQDDWTVVKEDGFCSMEDYKYILKKEKDILDKTELERDNIKPIKSTLNQLTKEHTLLTKELQLIEKFIEDSKLIYSLG